EKIFLKSQLSVLSQFNPLLPFTEHLDQAGEVSLRWGFDQPQDVITFELTVTTTGWVEMGFSPGGDMVGADIVIGGVLANGSTYFMDGHSTGNTVPLVDIQQNYIPLALSEADGRTVMKFQRSIQPCDKDDCPTPLRNVIYAYGGTDEIDYHYTQRGKKELNLLNYSPRTNHSNTSYFEIVANNFTVPAVHTHYYCWIMQLPTLNKKHHIYRIEPVIEHVDLVHHILLYRCSPRINSSFEGTCYSGNLLDLEQCMDVMASWGVGGGVSLPTPENAGIPIGGVLNKSYYRLEIHYNNPALTSAMCSLTRVTDNSGLRFHYTPDLRLHDAAILTTGLVNSARYVIPPNATAFQSYAACSTSLFNQVLSTPAPDLNVFAAILHTHLAGRKVRVAHFRNKEQIGFLGVDENYDFNLQQTTYLGNVKTLKMLGLSTSKEMCLAFLYYYPAIHISVCSSLPNFNELQGSMGAKTWDEDAIKEYQNKIKRLSQLIYVADINVSTSPFFNHFHCAKE
uniref:Monooxygenase, DBH-like 1, like n=1 Tax=Scleropages formosus TaxID=113540 RepID=A0A8C9SAW4_SCLFO